MASNGLVASFVAAIQASLSVLLVIFYGAVAARWGLLTSANTKPISKVCVRMFLPALLFTKIGAELHAGSASRYVVVLVWALVCHAISFVLGIAAHLFLGMPDWTTVAIMFNNTTSYPLLLVAALDQTGILSALVGADETTREALERAKSYFLVFSTVSSCLTFAVGPRLIDTEHAPEPDPELLSEEGDDDDDDKAVENENGSDGVLVEDPDSGSGSSSSSGSGFVSGSASGSRSRTISEACDPLTAAPIREDDNTAEATETTGLLGGQPLSKTPSRSSGVVRFVDPFGPPNSFFPSIKRRTNGTITTRTPTTSSKSKPVGLHRRVSVVPKKHWIRLGPHTRWWLLFIADFFNAPMLGALAGAVVGLTPSLHRAFFADGPDGGIFSAWLTASLDDIGTVFVPLPVVIAGVSLYSAMQTASSPDNAAGRLPWLAVTYILIIRFVLWPLASIATIYVLAARTSLVGDDPMLWFALMLMPTGPPAMKLITLVQVSDGDDSDETAISKLLTISYLISPLLSLTVVGSLRASQHIMNL